MLNVPLSFRVLGAFPFFVRGGERAQYLFCTILGHALSFPRVIDRAISYISCKRNEWLVLSCELVGANCLQVKEDFIQIQHAS